MFKYFLKITFRNILKYKGYSIINISGLALGMVACLIILLYVQDELIYDNHYPDAEQIFRVVLDLQTGDEEIEYASTPSSLAMALKSDFPIVEQAVRLMTNPETAIRFGENKKFNEDRIYHTDTEIFDVFHIPFLYGDKNTCFNHPNSVVITEEIAHKYFGSHNPIGSLLDFGYAKFEVTGVLENISQNTHLKFDFLLPLNLYDSENWKAQGWDNFDGQTGLIYTYIKIHQNADLDELKKRLSTTPLDYPGLAKLAKVGLKQSYSVQQIRDIHLHSHRRNEAEPPGSANDVAILSLIALSILLISCLNFVNLTTARASTRLKEVGISKVMGAFRSRLVLRFAGESVFVALLAMIIAVFIVEITLPWFSTLINKELNYMQFADVQTLFFMLAVGIIVGILAGIYPALLISSIQPVAMLRGLLKENLSATSLRKILVISQFAISAILIIATLIIYQQLHFMKHSELGFEKGNLLILPVPTGSLFDQHQREFIMSEFARYHSVHSISATSFIPGNTKHLFKGGFKLIDESDPKNYDMNILMVDFEFLKTYNIDLSAGRFFDVNMSTDISNACVINEAATRAMGNIDVESAVGKRLFDFEERKIIGIIKDFHYQSLQHAIEPLVMMVNPDFYVYLSLRTEDRHLSETIDFVKNKWSELFPNEPFVYNLINDIFEEQYHSENNFSKIIFLFTGLAIFIACLGLFGLIMFTTERRTKEIGIRKVMGSSEAGIVLILSKELFKWVVYANLIALPLSWLLMNKWLQNYPYRIKVGVDTFIAAISISSVIAFMTVSLRTLRAARANPAASLRYE